MATGITKNKWTEDTEIISCEEYAGDFSYEISYQNKSSVDTILKSFPESNYISVFNTNMNNKLYYGDNLDVLKYLFHQGRYKGKINLIYIDPPYGTNSVFQSRNQKSSYKDDLIGSHYIEFMRKRLIFMRELLSDNGSIYIHLDGNMTFQIKVIMDEIFGARNYRGTITRKKCSNKNFTKNTYGNISDYILFYSKTDNYIWNRASEPWPEEKIRKEYPCIDESSGKKYKKVPIHAPGTRNGETGKKWKGMLPPPGKHWQYTPKKLTELDNKGYIYWSANGNPRRKVFFDEDKGIPVQNIWLDVQDSLNQNIRITGYPTEKNPYILERIIEASSNEGDVVLDCFAGSGTTLDVADQLKRNFIGIDNSSEAIFTIVKRFYKGLEEMGDYVSKREQTKNTSTQLSLFEIRAKYNPKLSFRKNFEIISDSRFINKIYDILIHFDLKRNNDNTINSVCEKRPSAHEILIKDPILKMVIPKIGEFNLSPKSSKFAFKYICDAIISQQLSLAASTSIISNVESILGKSYSPQNLIEMSENELKSLGISNRKISYLKDLAYKVLNKLISINNLKQLSNEDVIEELTKVKGIGKWTAKMYLIFVLARPDVFPIEDAAFMGQLKLFYNLPDNGGMQNELDEIEKRWSPFQSIGAWYMWQTKDKKVCPKTYEFI